MTDNRLGVVLVLAIIAQFHVRCGPQAACNKIAPTGSDKAPQITSMVYNGQPFSDDPFTLAFTVDFKDADGDLSGGSVEFFLNDNPSTTKQLLADVFRQSGVETTSKKGRLGLALRFTDDVPDGTQVRLGVQFVDQKGNRSNCASLDLDFNVTPLAKMIKVKNASVCET